MKSERLKKFRLSGVCIFLYCSFYKCNKYVSAESIEELEDILECVWERCADFGEDIYYCPECYEKYIQSGVKNG